MNLNGLSIINIEISSKCGFNCKICGRRKIEKEYPEIAKSYGHMSFDLLKEISKQTNENILHQFHNNGCPLEYPQLSEALKLFEGKIRSFNTKGGKKLVEKANEIIDNLETICISTIPNDPIWEEQLEYLKEFIRIKGDKKPRIIIRCTGNIEENRMKEYKKMDILIAKRILHSPMGSFDYEKDITIPEHGICTEILNHPAIDRWGNVSVCVRFDPNRKGILGNLKEQTLEEIWNGKKRKEWLQYHIDGHSELVPLCKSCQYWGIPRG